MICTAPAPVRRRRRKRIDEHQLWLPGFGPEPTPAKPSRSAPDPRYPPCRHCQCRPGRRNKGLCARCYSDRGVRATYPTQSRYGRRSDVGAPGIRRVPEPTDALPGSEAKILVLIGRAERGESLWHPRDANFAGAVSE